MMAACLAECSASLMDARMAVSKVVTWDDGMEPQKAAHWAEKSVPLLADRWAVWTVAN